MFEILKETRKTQLAVGVCCCLHICNFFKHVSDGVSTWVKFNSNIYHGYPVSISPLYNVECIVVVYTNYVI